MNWGHDIRILAGCDERYLPGFFALVNSAISNGFQGKFTLLVNDEFDIVLLPKQAPFEVLRHERDATIFQPAEKLGVLPNLPPGKYLLLDTDFIVERPCGAMLEPIESGLLVSTEPQPKYDPWDVVFWQQCKQLGFPTDLPYYPYINSGFLGFMLPRDRDILENYAALTRRHLKGVFSVFSHDFFMFPEQDILNLLVRKSLAKGNQVFSVSPRALEIGAPDDLGFSRAFPFESQKNNFPKDQIKYFIHGAALRRPWLEATRPGCKGKAEASGILPLRRKLLKRLTPYERAWAYYSCSPNMPITVESWAETYGFSAHKNPLWRLAFDL
jgi:hypothetical protein